VDSERTAGARFVKEVCSEKMDVACEKTEV